VSYHDTDAPRDYGGWRRRRGIGMFGFGAAGTAAVLGALLVLIITATADAAALPYLAPPVLLAGGLGLARTGGEPLAVAALRRIRWQYGSARNWTRYRAAVVAGRRGVVLWHRRSYAARFGSACSWPGMGVLLSADGGESLWCTVNAGASLSGSSPVEISGTCRGSRTVRPGALVRRC
jgi:hypothetical protein